MSSRRPHPAKAAPASSGARGGSVAGALAALVLAAAVLPASGGVLASYYTPRVVVLYVAVACFVAFAAAAGLAKRTELRVDGLDGSIVAFAAWQSVAATTAPVALLAWFGAYNRIGGAVMWLALAAVFIVSRRILVGAAALAAFTWVVSIVTAIPVLVGVLQAAGAETPWPFVDLWGGRVPGTTGNPLNLAGLCLMGVWLAVVAARGGDDVRRGTRLVAAVGASMAAVGLVASSSRAGLAGMTVAGLVLAAAALWGRRARLALAAIAAVVIIIAAGLAYRHGGESGASLVERVALDPLAATYGLSGTDDSRGTFWRVAVNGIRERPLAGYGAGGYLVAYRAFVPAETLQDKPLSAVTDPHSVPLLIAVGSGLPGLALACLCVVLAALAARQRWREGSQEQVSAGFHRGATRRAVVLAGVAAGSALLVFLSVSPADPAALVPLMLVAGIGAGPPRRHARLHLALPPGRSALVVRASLLVVALIAGVAITVVGGQLIRADAAARLAVAEGDREQALRAAELFPQIAAYDLAVWDTHLRAASSAGNDSAVASAALPALRRGVAADPTDPLLRVALARYHLMTGNAADATAELRSGLRFNPGHPLLQALLGYIAHALAGDLATRQSAQGLLSDLSALSRKGADGWYWQSVASAALGDTQGAVSARVEALRLAPEWEAAEYERRVRGDFSDL